jgi:MoaA/NifB/PqqE/SkfB family radical SAM enzyme
VIRDVANELLVPGPLQQIRLDLTTRCNLRCVYCAVSQITYRCEDMPVELAHRATDHIAQIARNRNLRPHVVDVNGHGETTFMHGWVDVCNSLLDHNLSLSITTNLAKAYSPDELEVLAQMYVINVSIDTCDPELLKRLRRRADVRQIVANIKAVRETSLRIDHEPPNFQFSCGLYDKNSLSLVELAEFAVGLEIYAVGFWNLTKWPHDWFTDVAEHDRAFPLDELSDSELRPRVDAIQKGIGILKDNGVKVNVNGDFVSALERRLNGGLAGVEAIQSYELPKGMTRDCTDPWTYAELETNGDVKPCCARTGVGNLGQQELSQILSGEPIRRLRSDLLGGTPDSDCAKCHLRGATTPEALREKVLALLHDGTRGRYFDTVFSNRIQFLLKTGFEHLQSGRPGRAWSCVNKALNLDPGIRQVYDYGDITIRAHLKRILAEAQFPLTLTWLAAICREIGDGEASTLLLKRYLVLAPDAPDWDHVANDLSIVAR